MKKKLYAISFFTVAISFAHAQSWLLNGNSGINQSANFLGTNDAKPLIIKTNGIERMRISNSGKIGIGTTSPDARFNVKVNSHVTLTTTDSFLLGDLSSANIAFDNNEIQARNNNAGSTLYLNYWGGAVFG